MKILAAADVHGIRPVYDWLLAAAREYRVDAIVLAGDLLGCVDGFDTPEAAQQHESAILASLLDTAEMAVLYIMGNDDLVELNSTSNRVRSIHGRRVQCGHFGFVGYQYSLPFMGGTFEKPDDGIAGDLVPLATLMDVDTVFVSHSPAHASWISDLETQGSAAFRYREFLKEHPFHAHIHGHSHAGVGRVGRHFNVASAGRARSMIIDLRTMGHQVLDRIDSKPNTAPAPTAPVSECGAAAQRKR
jgi:Icc-related predicted phosphoesterase